MSYLSFTSQVSTLSLTKLLSILSDRFICFFGWICFDGLAEVNEYLTNELISITQPSIIFKMNSKEPHH